MRLAGSVITALLFAATAAAVAPTYTKRGSFDAATGESSILYWPPAGGVGREEAGLVISESIFCDDWYDHYGHYDHRFEGHSYVRLRNYTSGAIIANITLSIGFSFSSGFVDHETGTFFLFAHPMDRCTRQPPPNVGSTDGVWQFSSRDLLTWDYARTDVAWNGPNTDVARVYAPGRPPPNLPPHRYIMITEGATFAVNNNADGDLTRGWVTLPAANASVPQCPEGCQCPSIRYLPSDGFYYVITGGHSVWLLRSKDLQTWEQPAAARTPFIAPSADDGLVASIGGGPENVRRSDFWYAARGQNTTSAMLANLEDWDWNSNDADVCCESWHGAQDVIKSYVIWGPSSQGAQPRGGLNGPSCMQAIAVAEMPLDKMLQSYFVP
jgi:hypothetical protein